MVFTHLRLGLVIFGVIAGMGVSKAAVDVDAASADANSSNQLQEVVVTARRRTESGQTTPVSETSVSTGDLIAREVLNIADIAQFTPNLTVESATGSKAATVVQMRGQVLQDNLASLDSSVGVYVNDIYLARSYSVLTELLDVQQVEVLEGPQGTLYGRNTNGGAIKVTTVAPDVHATIPTGFFAAGAGNYGATDVSGAVTIPLITDKLAIRYAGSYGWNDGYTRTYVVPTGSVTPTGRVDSDNLNTYTQRISLAFQPTDKLSFDVVGSYNRNNDRGIMFVNPTGDIESSTGFNFATLSYASNVFRNSPQRQSDFWAALSNVAPYSRSDEAFFSLRAAYEISDALTAKVIYGHSKSTNHSLTNSDGIVADGQAYLEYKVNQQESQHQDSVELQLTGTALDSRLTWITGLYYFKENATEGQAGSTQTFAFFGETGVRFAGDVENTSKSVYVSSIYKLTDQWSFSVGGRYTQDDRDLDSHNTFEASGACVFTLSVTGPCSYATSASFSHTTWEAESDYKFTPDLYGYAKIGTGYRSGGLQLRALDPAESSPFQPETVTNYEVGFKSEWWEHRLRANISAFHTDYNNVQASIVSATSTGAITTIVENAAKAKINGFELEASGKLGPYVTVNTSYGYTHVSYAQPNEAGIIHPVLTPMQTAAASIVYSHPSVLGTVSTRLDGSYSSSYWTNPTLITSPTATPNTPGHTLLNARASLDMTSGLMLSAYVKNLANRKYYVGDDTVANLSNDYIGAPRTYGVEVRYNF